VKLHGPFLALSLVVIVATTSGVARSDARRAPDQSGTRAPPAGNTAASAAAEVERLERELVAAIAKGDMVTYDRIVADDYVAYPVSARVTTKAEVIASYRTGTRRYTNLSISAVDVRVYGETAILSARTSGTVVEQGRPSVPNDVRYFRLFTKRAGVWRAVMQIVTPPPPD
jgi:ketosteroid isomerase-like protein